MCLEQPGCGWIFIFPFSKGLTLLLLLLIQRVYALLGTGWAQFTSRSPLFMCQHIHVLLSTVDVYFKALSCLFFFRRTIIALSPMLHIKAFFLYLQIFPHFFFSFLEFHHSEKKMVVLLFFSFFFFN